MAKIESILSLIEEARKAGELGNDQARTASVALGLEGHEALLACRLIAQGPDPASLDYLDTGEIAPKIMEAHRGGPGVYDADDPELADYLALCALSSDESQGALDTVRGRVFGFLRALTRLNNPDEEFKDAALAELGRQEKEWILSLPWTCAMVAGKLMRVYTSDRGFAAAAWDGTGCAAVLGTYDGKPYLSIGAPPYRATLEEQGVRVDKALSDRFGIVEDEDEVAAAVKAVAEAAK